jgi:hypothetical protein
MAHHAFVAMPFGIKEDIDFNAVFRDLIKPALEGAGFEVFRADEEMRAGNIRTDMFQELLLADLVKRPSMFLPNVRFVTESPKTPRPQRFLMRSTWRMTRKIYRRSLLIRSMPGMDAR